MRPPATRSGATFGDVIASAQYTGGRVPGTKFIGFAEVDTPGSGMTTKCARPSSSCSLRRLTDEGSPACCPSRVNSFWPVHTFVIDDQAVAFEQDVEAPVAKASAHRRHRLQPGQHGPYREPPTSVAISGIQRLPTPVRTAKGADLNGC